MKFVMPSKSLLVVAESVGILAALPMFVCSSFSQPKAKSPR